MADIGHTIGTAWIQVAVSGRGIEAQVTKALNGTSVTRSTAGLGSRIAAGIGRAIARTPEISRGLAASIRSGSESMRILGMYAADAARETIAALRPVGAAMASVATRGSGALLRSIQSIPRVTGQAVTGATVVLRGLAGVIGRTVTGALDYLAPSAMTAMRAFAGQVRDGMGVVASSVHSLWGRVGDGASQAFSRLSTTAAWAYRGVADRASDAWGRVSSAVGGAMQTAVGHVRNFGMRTYGEVYSAYTKATAPVREFAGRVQQTMSGVTQAVGSRLAPVAGQVTAAMGRAGTAITTTMSRATSMVSTAAQRIGAAWAPVGQHIASAVGRGVSAVGGRISSALSSAGSAAASVASRVGSSIGSALSSTVQAGVSAAQMAVIGLGTVIAANLGGAVERADMLNNFPKVMENIGYSADEAREQIDRISDSLDGLPTSTDAVARTAQGLAPLTGNLTSATDVSLALNNALLAGGASATLAENAMEQYRQMLSVGTVDMAAWRSMTQAMPGQMEQLAHSILGTSASTSDLYEAMKDGAVSFDDFNSALVEVNENGVDGLASFSDQARTATQGIGTAFQNVGNRIRKALATILEAIGVDRISGVINDMTSGIVGLGNSIAGFITRMREGGAAVSSVSVPFQGLLPVIGGLVGALGGLASGLPFIGGAFAGLSGPVGIVIGLFAAMWANSETLRNAVTSAFSQMGVIISALSPVVSAVSVLFSQIATVIGNALGQAISAVMPGLTSLAQSVFPVLAQIISTLTPVFSSLVSLIATVFVGAIKAIMPPLVSLGQAVFPAILQVVRTLAPPVQNIITQFQSLAQKVLPVLGSILSTVASLIGRIVAAVLPPLARILGTVISVIGSLISIIMAVAVPAFNAFMRVANVAIRAIGAIFGWLWRNIVNPVIGWINQRLNTFKVFLDEKVRPIVTRVVSIMGSKFNAFKSVISTVFTWITTKIDAFKNFLNNTVKPKVSSIATTMGNAFSKLKTTVGTAMNRIKGVAAKPINFVINTVYRDGIKKAFDKIAEKIGLSLRMPTVSAIPGYASGGVLPGYTPGRDVYDFISYNGGGRLQLSGGEAIMRPEWVRAVGGKRAVDAMNKAASRGRALPVGDRGQPGVNAFAPGGIWDSVKDTVTGAVSTAVDWVSNAADAVGSIIDDPMGAITNLVKKPVEAILDTIPGGGMWRDIAKAVPGKIIGGLGDWLKGGIDNDASWAGVGATAGAMVGAPSGSLVGQARRAMGTPYVWGGVSVPGGVDCSGLIVWALRAMGKNVPRHTAATFQSNSTPVGNPAPGDLVFWGRPAYHVAVYSGGGRIVEAPTFGMRVRETPVYGAVSFGRFRYDDGGYLQPGFTMVENATGKPEPVFTSGQWDKIENSTSMPSELAIYDVNNELIGRMRTEASRVVTSTRTRASRSVR